MFFSGEKQFHFIHDKSATDMTQLEEILKLLNTEMQSMALLVVSQLDKTKKAILEFDKAIAKEVIANEPSINATDLKIDSLCENIVALYTPVAKDMRMVFAFYKINSYLERIGDYARNICGDITSLENPYNADLLKNLKIERMFAVANEMIYQNIAAIATNDLDAAKSVFEMDEELDELNYNGNKLLADYMVKHTEQIADLLNLSSAIRRLERVGDYNTNIAEELFFYQEAMVLKHKNKT